MSNKNFKITNEDVTMPMLCHQGTKSYCKVSKILVVLQNPDKRFRKNCSKQVMSTFEQACQVYSDDDCNCMGDSCDLDCGSSKKNRKVYKDDILESCRRGVNVVVVNLFRWSDSFVQDLAYIAYQTKYCLIFEPPLVTCRNMTLRKTHVSFGWFINDTDSACLREEASLYLLDCLRMVPEFGKNYSKYSDLSRLVSFYHLEDNLQEILYCRSCICNTPEKSSEYLKNTPALKFYGKLDLLQIVGFIISPGFVAAKVYINDKQNQLWNFSDAVSGVETLQETNKFALKLNQVTVSPLTCKVSKSTMWTLGKMPYKLEQLIQCKGRTAHFVLGKSCKLSALETNMDVATVMERALNSFSNDVGDVGWYDCGRSYAKKFGKYWFITLKHMVGVDAIFASSCVTD